MKTKDPKEVKKGKKNKERGGRFELKVRKDLEEKYFIDKWTNNVEFFGDMEHADNMWGCKSVLKGKMHTAKHKFNPFSKAMTIGTGFPDFICFRRVTDSNNLYQVIGVEARSKGYLSKIEKEKCKWYLDNHVFSKIWIASKGEKRGEIIYKEFKTSNDTITNKGVKK